LKGRWIDGPLRDAVVDFVLGHARRTGLGLARLVAWIGLSRERFSDWRRRYGQPNRHNAAVPRDFWLQAWERRAIVAFYREHPGEGYRRVAYMMLDADVVAVSPSSVYRVLKEEGLLRAWPRTASKKGTGFEQPLQAHQHWHVDVSYLNMAGTFYYFCAFLDGYSRFIVHWEIRESMTEADVQIILQRAREKFPQARPRIISDNGSAFIAREFQRFVRLAGMTHVRTSPYYPQSNGKMERFHQSLKREAIRPRTPVDAEDARRVAGSYVDHYNHVRLHSAIGYLAPIAKLEGRAEVIWDGRRRKLREARLRRQAQPHLLAAGVVAGGEPPLTKPQEIAMVFPAGETEAGSAGEQPAKGYPVGTSTECRGQEGLQPPSCPPSTTFLRPP
jgi:putative transposase